MLRSMYHVGHGSGYSDEVPCTLLVMVVGTAMHHVKGFIEVFNTGSVKIEYFFLSNPTLGN